MTTYFRNNYQKMSNQLITSLNEIEYCSWVIFLENCSNRISQNRM